MAVLESAGESGEQGEVALDLLVHPGALHLDGDAAPVGEERAMDLRERGGRERLVFELGEQVRERSAQLAGDDPLCLLARERRHCVVQRAQRLCVGERDVVGAEGEHLASLDEGGAEPFEHGPKPLG